MASRSIFCREELRGNDEGEPVGPKVETNLAENVQSDGYTVISDAVGTAGDDEEEAQDNEHRPL